MELNALVEDSLHRNFRKKKNEVKDKLRLEFAAGLNVSLRRQTSRQVVLKLNYLGVVATTRHMSGLLDPFCA
ncbi:hypothetical protein H5410_025960 [Solanum commersonii]|uniref:Uncharacterized protein n=1 Tax=Solanum commersonii TaxID=4109 RepID=A0A9J5YZF1_SOLCO|nr:hypothetical protein H5410_025960 [Solanum commersonii]